MAARRRAPTLCLATPAKPKAADENEEILDEMAMRAAEIHEVLTGLEEFKMRIIDGAFPRLRCTVCDCAAYVNELLRYLRLAGF